MLVLFYLALFGLSSLMIFLAERQENRIVKGLLSIAAIAIPVALLSLRFSDTGDYNSYRRIANTVFLVPDVPSYLIENGIEPTFYLFSLLSQQLFGGWYGIFALYGAATVAVGFIAVRLWCPDKKYLWAFWLIWLLIVFPNSFNLLRQALAFNIVFVGLWWLYKNSDWKKALALVLVACFFHVSSIFFLPFFIVWWLRRTKNRQKTLAILIAVGVICVIVAAILALVWQQLPVKYTGYFTNENWRLGRTWFGLSRAILLAVVVGAFYVKRKKQPLTAAAYARKVEVPEVVLMATALACLFTLQLLPSPFSRIADFIWVFFFWWAFEVSQRLNLSSSGKRLLASAVLAVCVVMFIGVEYLYNYHGMFPYRLLLLEL
ncbi:EpsG family protein [Candidatus Saccharibacteria bacterium]|nr:EpsG family protein [Candidatus Saccharibacteria bacterium]